MKLRIKLMIWNTRKQKQPIRTTRRKRIQENEGSVKNLWDNLKRTNICMIGVLETEKREKKIENVFEKMTEDFPNLAKEIDTQVQEAQRVPNKLGPMKTTPRHITIKMLKVKDKREF